jgi:hypothetical protein
MQPAEGFSLFEKLDMNRGLSGGNLPLHFDAAEKFRTGALGRTRRCGDERQPQQPRRDEETFLHGITFS